MTSELSVDLLMLMMIHYTLDLMVALSQISVESQNPNTVILTIVLFKCKQKS